MMIGISKAGVALPVCRATVATTWAGDAGSFILRFRLLRSMMRLVTDSSTTTISPGTTVARKHFRTESCATQA